MLDFRKKSALFGNIGIELTELHQWHAQLTWRGNNTMFHAILIHPTPKGRKESTT
jgi:hypothetical protein